jgi:hypothetical protein
MRWIFSSALVFLMLPTVHAAEKSGALKINHTPVTWAVKGQSLTLKARVSGGVGGVDSVTLYYALFRDAAPFRVTMASSGMDTFVGTIDAGLLTGVENLSYYIEAQDKEGTIEETPWYDVKFKNPESAPVMRNDNSASTGGATKANKDEGMSAATIGIIAGSAVAVGAGAYFLSDSGGGSSSDDGGGGGGGNKDNTGNYAGNATTCLTLSGSQPACETTTAQFVIDANGKVFTDTLYPGKQLTGTLSGNDFSLVADVNEPDKGLTGTIVYSGTVVDASRIVGTTTGNALVNGTPGTYSGTFSAPKQ